MARPPSDASHVLNDFLRVFLDDLAAGRVRDLDEYRVLFPDHASEIEREYAELREAAPEAPGPAGGSLEQQSAGQRFGPYVLVRLLGRGGQGLVWLARDTRLQRLVALKLQTALAALSPQSLARFHREAHVASRLEDPGICTVYETGSEHGVPYLAMRYVEGESLAAKIERAREGALRDGASVGIDLQGAGGDGGPLEPLERIAHVALLIERLARSLHKAHEAGIVHRDVKPANVLVDHDGLPVLLDFGLAGLLDETLPTFTRTGDVFGTPAYMAPEQLAQSGTRSDRRVDVYALGATLYECLTLRHPFEGVPREALYQAIRDRTPSDPRLFERTIPPDLKTILDTCLAKDRERRYATALALAEDLRRFGAGEPILARPASRVYRTRKFVQRYRVLVASTLAVVAALAAAAVLSTTGMLRARRAEADERVQRGLAERGELEARRAEARAQRERARAEEHRLDARREAYAAQMGLAYDAWRKRNYGRVLALLAAQRPEPGEPDLRGFEWSCLWSLCRPGLERAVRDPDGRPILAAAVSARDGSLLVLSDVGRVRKYRMSDGALLETRELPDLKPLSHAAFSPDGSRLFVLGSTGGRVWDVATWSEIARLPEPAQEAGLVAVSPDGRRLAWVGDGATVQVLDVDRTATVLDHAHGLDVVQSLALSPNGSLLAVGGDREAAKGVLTLVDVATGAVVDRVEGLPGSVIELAFSSDGKRLAVGASDWIARILAVDGLEELCKLEGHQGGIAASSFSPDDRLLATWGGSDSTLRVFDLDRAIECAPPRVVAWPAHVPPLFTPDGRSVVTAGGDGITWIWSARAEPFPIEVEAPLDLPHDYLRHGLVAFAPDSRTLVLNSRVGGVALLDVESRQVQAVFEPGSHVTCAAFLPGALVLGSEDGELVRLSLEDLEPEARVSAHRGRVNDVQVSPDGRLVASCGRDGRLALWEPGTLASRAVQGPPSGGEIHSVLFDSASASLLSIAGREIARWSWVGDMEAEILSGGGYEIASSPDGRHLAYTDTGWTAGIVELSTRGSATVLSGHAGGSYHALDWAPDGQTLATGSVDHTVKLWQVATGRELLTLEHSMHVHDLDFSPDGRWLATWTCDGILRLWPTATPAELSLLEPAAEPAAEQQAGSIRFEAETLQIAHLEYHWSDAGNGAWSAPNRALDLRSRASAAGLEVSPRLGADRAASPWTLRLLARAGTAGRLEVLAAPELQAREERVEVDRGTLQERISNEEGGLRIRWTLPAGPAESAEILLELAGDLTFVGETERATTGALVDSKGVMRLRMEVLEAQDAIGRSVTTELSASTDGARLLLGARRAIYPLRVELLLDAPAAKTAVASASFGSPVACAGDVDGDGYDDIAVGAQRWDDGHVDAGAVFLFLGSAQGVEPTPAWWVTGGQERALLPTALAAAGDVNRDGCAELLIGAAYRDGEHVDAGWAGLFQGSQRGLARTPIWELAGEQASAGLGGSVASAGDVDGDGCDDVLVGANGLDGDQPGEGRAYLFRGSARGLGGAPAWTGAGDEAGAAFGTSVAGVGDIDGDGYDDVVVGAQLQDEGDLVDAGRIYLYRGSSAGLSSAPAWLLHGTQAQSNRGYKASSAGDVDGDGRDDLLSGAHSWDAGALDEGRACLHQGSVSGSPIDSGWSPVGGQDGAYFGSSFCGGDVNGDGFSDVLVGASAHDDSRVDQGRVSLYLGSARGLAGAPIWTACGAVAHAQFGLYVSAGDVDGDACDDLIVGAPGEAAGRVHIYYGAAFGSPGSPGLAR